jgi:hypothetical protein
VVHAKVDLISPALEQRSGRSVAAKSVVNAEIQYVPVCCTDILGYVMPADGMGLVHGTIAKKPKTAVK